MNRDFDTWFSTFIESIFNYKYYVNFEKVFDNVKKHRDEYNLLNSLIGCHDQEGEFKRLIAKYPSILKIVPLLLAKRGSSVYAIDSNGEFWYNFNKPNLSIDQYCYFMRETGLFDLFENHLVNNVVDYALGVETGLDSNGRKNRGGDQMEDLVESFLKKMGLLKNVNYFKEMYIHEVREKWGISLPTISDNGKTEKRFDFVVENHGHIFGIETNFYGSGGSKLNETARSYKQIAEEAKGLKDFTFVWITDGKNGWTGVRHNLQETFEVLETMYDIADLKNGSLKKLFGSF